MYINYYQNLEKAMYTKQEFEADKIEEVNESPEGRYLKNKMFILACYDEGNR